MRYYYKIAGLIILIGIFLAGAAMAEEKLNDCCKVRAGFSMSATESYQAGDIIKSNEPGAVCELKPDPSKTEHAKDNWGMLCMLNTVYTVTNWVFYIMTAVAALMIVFGGFTYLTAAGDPGKAGKGKGILMYAIIGLAIALIAKVIPSLVRFILGL